MAEPIAFGSTSPDIEKSEQLLRERKEATEKRTAASVDGGASPSPALVSKRKPATKKTPEPSPEDVKSFPTFYTKVVGYFLKDKTPPTADELDLLTEGSKGTFRKFPGLFLWFAPLTLLAGMILFVVNRIGKGKNESRQQVDRVDRGNDRNGEKLPNGTNDTERKAATGL